MRLERKAKFQAGESNLVISLGNDSVGAWMRNLISAFATARQYDVSAPCGSWMRRVTWYLKPGSVDETCLSYFSTY